MAEAAVFASGRGSNFIAIHRHLESLPGKPHKIAALVSDKDGCGAVEFARKEGIRVFILAYQKSKARELVETELLQEFAKQNLKPDLLVFAGFMRIVTKTLIDAFPHAIINIHPSLLPKHPGANGIEDSVKSGDSQLGITIHYVDYGMDTGPVILQRSFDRRQSETLGEIENKIHALEHESYPEIVEILLSEKTKAMAEDKQ